ncbi:hypothetical protein B0O80DRAFT_424982 [Mortierella sp. GBAus27b]|nr:hypothetical protein B0O80DRAFT_424982 [Mortierella sp. GBAus27b]
MIYPRVVAFKHWYQYPIILILLLVVLLQSTASAQAPPAPQPGLGIDPNGVPAASDSTPTKTLGPEPGSHVTSTRPPIPNPSVTTTVTVINGTTTLTTVTNAPTAPPGIQQPPTITSLTKPPQSVLIVQSTTYGMVLPAAGPSDDTIEGHFWDRFVPQGSQTSTAIRVSPLFEFPVYSLCCLYMGWLFLTVGYTSDRE